MDHYDCTMSIRIPKPRVAPRNELITLTFGDMAENHVGMEQIGQMVAEGQGFQLADLQAIQHAMEARGVVCELMTLSSADQPAAYVLVMRKGVNALLDGKTQFSMFTEQKGLVYDKQAFMYGRVVNKHARWNLCFDENSREPDYEAGKGRIVGYHEVPVMKSLMDQIATLFGPKAANLKVESNYYYDTTKCGIGFHGDSERRVVVGVRIGYASLPMNWQWFHQGKPIGDRIIVPLEPGDMYIMSEKAVGTDWKKKTIPTLRHATGCDKFTTISE
jgi:hypothetical protein